MTTKTTQPGTATLDLPPYSAFRSACPKCAAVRAKTRYVPGYGPLPEHLKRICAQCGHEWPEALNPPSTTHATTGHATTDLAAHADDHRPGDGAE